MCCRPPQKKTDVSWRMHAPTIFHSPIYLSVLDPDNISANLYKQISKSLSEDSWWVPASVFHLFCSPHRFFTCMAATRTTNENQNASDDIVSLTSRFCIHICRYLFTELQVLSLLNKRFINGLSSSVVSHPPGQSSVRLPPLLATLNLYISTISHWMSDEIVFFYNLKSAFKELPRPPGSWQPLITFI